MILEKFRKHMAVVFWIVVVAFIVMFGWSSVWDSLSTIIGKNKRTTEIPTDTAFIIKNEIIPLTFYNLEVTREIAQYQQQGNNIGLKERGIIEEGIFLNKILQKELENKASIIGFSLSDAYLSVLLDTFSFYDRFYYQIRTIDPDYYKELISQREISKEFKILMSLAGWLSPIQVINQMHIQGDEFTAEYVFYKGDIDSANVNYDSISAILYDSFVSIGVASLPERVISKYILLPYGAQEEDWVRVGKKMINIFNNLSVVENDSLKKLFSTIAKQISEDYGSRGDGGYIGWVLQNSPIEENFLQQAFMTETGNITQPFRTEYGWHIIYVKNNQIDSVEVSHILLKVSGDPERDQKTLDLLETVMKEIEGTDIDSVAAKYSLEVNISSAYDRWGEYIPEFGFNQHAINYTFAADSGEIDGPYFSNNTIYILQPIIHTQATVMSYQEMEKDLVDSINIGLIRESAYQKAEDGVSILLSRKNLEEVANRTDGIFVESKTFKFYDQIPYSPSADIVQAIAFTAPDTGYYGPIVGYDGAYIIHVSERNIQPDSTIQHDLPYFWFNMSLARGNEFAETWTSLILKKAFMKSVIKDFRFREKDY